MGFVVSVVCVCITTNKTLFKYLVLARTFHGWVGFQKFFREKLSKIKGYILVPLSLETELIEAQSEKFIDFRTPVGPSVPTSPTGQDPGLETKRSRVRTPEGVFLL